MDGTSGAGDVIDDIDNNTNDIRREYDVVRERHHQGGTKGIWEPQF